MNWAVNQNVLEICSYSLVCGTEEKQFVQAAARATRSMRAQRGFLARSVAKADDGSWTEIVHWLDRRSADSAADRIPKTPDAAAYYALIDKPSFRRGVYPVACSG
ncbi:hypothetical protein OSH11_02570 [Kaistia dalseonensis]|uniref:Antibiotic biosynthesis monooxygenase n=1 Tax=Kaistia dalseonensis TaxID=410840 RepID=A0ABU0H1G9_9HYPH|nr:hypothetical protein [Kaistia dalseonensis]MCX5493582.1 hypothetical protein [Kaistia dalseonensis]MDQ0436142.1 hypothetical protein [Kaistia dalseonensis]